MRKAQRWREHEFALSPGKKRRAAVNTKLVVDADLSKRYWRPLPGWGKSHGRCPKGRRRNRSSCPTKHAPVIRPSLKATTASGATKPSDIAAGLHRVGGRHFQSEAYSGHRLLEPQLGGAYQLHRHRDAADPPFSVRFDPWITRRPDKQSRLTATLLARMTQLLGHARESPLRALRSIQSTSFLANAWTSCWSANDL